MPTRGSEWVPLAEARDFAARGHNWFMVEDPSYRNERATLFRPRAWGEVIRDYVAGWLRDHEGEGLGTDDPYELASLITDADHLDGVADGHMYLDQARATLFQYTEEAARTFEGLRGDLDAPNPFTDPFRYEVRMYDDAVHDVLTCGDGIATALADYRDMPIDPALTARVSAGIEAYYGVSATSSAEAAVQEARSMPRSMTVGRERGGEER